MAHLNFKWDYAAPQGITFNLYEDGNKIVEDIGQLDFSLLMDGKPDGHYDYEVTAFDTQTHRESVPSNSVGVDFFVPAEPTNLVMVGWSA